MKGFKRTTINDIIEWDVENWGQSLAFWEKQYPILNSSQKLNCLELGGRRGGPSLWLALKGHDVLCTDIQNPEEKAIELHKKYDFDGKIEYAAMDALQIPESSNYDVIISKSIVGGVSRSGNDANKRKVIEQVYKALKPGGVFLLAENMEGSRLHQLAREKFVKWGSEWNYFNLLDLQLFDDFTKVSWQTVGFLGTFGRTEKQRQALGKIDQIIAPLVPLDQRYVLICCAQKPQ